MMGSVGSLTLFIILVTLAARVEASASSAEELYRVVDRLLDPTVYNKKVRPGVQLDKPLTVTLNIFINAITAVDEVNMAFTMNIYFRGVWLDNRLASDEFNGTLTLDQAYFDKFWVPDAFFSNGINGKFNDITVPNRFLQLSSDGSILYSQRLTLTLGCQMDLTKYPLDNQTCVFEIESYGYTADELLFKWKDQESIQMADGLALSEFVIVDSILGDCTKHYITGSFTCISGGLNLQRQFDYHLTRTFVPSSLIVALSWMSFWIDAHSVPARISLALLTVLSITTQSSGISQRLPKVSYVKAIDIWMTTCLALVFAALIEFCIVNVLARKKHIKDKQMKEMMEKRAKEKVGNGTKDAEKTEPATKLTHRLNAKVSTLQTDGEGGQAGFQTKSRSTFVSHLIEDKALMVDTISRGLFPLFFVVFNIGYWSHFKADNEPI